MSAALHDYLLMGGYAPFIWPAYAVAALVLIAFAIDSWRRVHRATTDLRRLEAEAAMQARPAKSRPARDGSAGNKAGDQAVLAQAVLTRSGQQQPAQQTPDQQAGS